MKKVKSRHQNGIDVLGGFDILSLFGAGGIADAFTGDKKPAGPSVQQQVAAALARQKTKEAQDKAAADAKAAKEIAVGVASLASIGVLGFIGYKLFHK